MEVVRVRITLACTECKQRNYNMTKDKKTHPDRMETKKYCRFCKRHTLHKETKYSGDSSKGSEGMAKTEKTEKGSKMESWMNGLKAEFKKIIWPDQKTLVKQTGAVVAVSIVLGVMIALLDFIFQYGVDILVNISF